MSNVETRILMRSSEAATCQCHWHGNDGKWICCWCGTETYSEQTNDVTVTCFRRTEDSLTAWLWTAKPAARTAAPRRRLHAGAAT